MKETYNIKAIVLQRYPFREFDLRLEVFSEKFGKQELIVRGAKKINSKLAGHLEPFNLSKIMVIHGKQLNYAGGAICLTSFPEIKNNIEKTKWAGLGLKFFNKIIKEEEKESGNDLFLILLNFLKTIEEGVKNYELFLEIFKFNVLSVLGYRLNIDKCFSCGKILKEGKIYFSSINRNFSCSQCSKPGALLIHKDVLDFIKNKNFDFCFVLNDQNKKILDQIKKINQSLIFDL